MDATLTPEQWGAAWRLYEAVADLPEPDRERMLESSTEDPGVIRQVRTLLEGAGGEIPAEPVSRTGTRVSHYSVGERIGLGGMGEVYEALDLELDRPVAIKFLPERMLSEERAVRRFLTEARAASALNHPNLVTIHEFVRGEGLLAIVMERIAGQTLRRMPPVADAGGAGLQECLRRLAQLAEALAAAHAQGIIHRDLKPENIMLRADGYVKILDFGLAVLAERAVPLPGGGTAFSTLAGTPRYMSPEQKRNETLTPASDIYSLGLVFLEMLTGSADPAGLAALGSRVPSRVARLVSSMMAGDTGKRPAAADVAHEAVRLAPNRRRWPWWTAAALVAILAAVWAWRPGPPPPSAQALTVLPLTALPGEERGPSFSPDGEQVAFYWSGERGDNTDVYVMRLADRSVRRLTYDPAEDTSPLWSPDGKTIAFARHTGPLQQNALYLIPAEGGREREVGEVLGTLFGDWSPDGQWLVVRTGTGLAAIAAHTGELRTLLVADQGQAYATPAFSPDGRRIAFTRDRVGIGELMVLPLTADMKAAGPARAVRLAGFRTEECTNPRWTADGRSLVFTFNRGGANRLWRVRLPEDLAQEVTPELIGAGDGVESAALSGRTRRMVFAQVRSDANLWRVPLEGGGPPRKWVASSRDDRQGDLGADGRIVFESDRSGFREIWVTEPDGTGARALTSFGGPLTGSPKWSPDGRTIAFDSRRDGHPQIYAMDVPGPGEVLLPALPVARRVAQTGEQNVVPAWSPDGKWIYFQSPRAGTDRICRIPAGGGEVQVISPGFGRSPAPSPDGRWVYYGRLGDYWRCPAAGGPEELVAKRVVIRTAAPVAGGLWFLRTDGKETQIVYREEKTGAERIAARYAGRGERALAISRDQKYAIVTRLDEGQADLMMVENFDSR